MWDTEGCPTTDPQNSNKVKNIINDPYITGLTRQQLPIAAGTVDQAIVLPTATAEYLVVLTDQNISIKINGQPTAIVCKARIAGRKTLVFFNKGALTALTISNSGSAIANVDIVLASH